MNKLIQLVKIIFFFLVFFTTQATSTGRRLINRFYEHHQNLVTKVTDAEVIACPGEMCQKIHQFNVQTFLITVTMNICLLSLKLMMWHLKIKFPHLDI